MIDHAGTPGETMRTGHIRAVTTTDASVIAALNVAVQTLHWTAHPTQLKPPEPEAFEPTLQDLLARDEAFGFSQRTTRRAQSATSWPFADAGSRLR